MKFSAQELNAISRALGLEAERRKYRRLQDFIAWAWPMVEGTSIAYQYNWHIGLLCDHLEAVHSKVIPNLLVNVPPGSMKSIASSVCFPVWSWIQDPTLRFLSASYAEDLSLRDAVKSRSLIESPEFQRLWGGHVKINPQANQKRKYETILGGWRMATSVGGRGTGEHPSHKIVDDPHSAREAMSDAERQTALDWYDQTLSTRGASRDAATIVIMQRLHEKDLSGHIIASEEFATEWEHLVLPMKFEPGRYTSTIGQDPRTEPDELLWPKLFTKNRVRRLELKLGEYGTAGQLQQRPSPVGGGILKTKHFQLWPAGKPLPRFDLIIQSYDTAFKEKHQPSKTGKKAPDFSANNTWGLFIHPEDHRPAALLLDAWEERLAYPKLRAKVLKDWKARYGGDDERGLKGRRADVVIVEDKASGQSLIQDMVLANVPVTPYDPGNADKIAKAHMAAPLLELGRFYILESQARPGEWISWAQFMKNRIEKFPNDEFDDVVDTFTQAAIYIKNEGLIELDYIEEEIEPVDYHALKKARRNPYGQ